MQQWLFLIKCIEVGSIFWIIALIFVNALLVFQISLVNHNHRHQPVFSSRSLNRILDFMISIILLAPSTRLHAIHVLNHHSEFKTKNDWSSYKNISDSLQGFKRLRHYLVVTTESVVRHRKSLMLPVELKVKLIQERIFLVLYSLVVLYLSPLGFFLLVPSALLGLYLLVIANFANHDRCELDSDYNHSRNFLASVENWFFCNNGYHTGHHMRPTMHWSELPQFHLREINSKINPHLNNRSFFLYCFKNYLINRKSSQEM